MGRAGRSRCVGGEDIRYPLFSLDTAPELTAKVQRIDTLLL